MAFRCRPVFLNGLWFPFFVLCQITYTLLFKLAHNLLYYTPSFKKMYLSTPNRNVLYTFCHFGSVNSALLS
jgi:hypothetical protein